MPGDEEKPIRVVDRRMFTPDGELRPDFQPDEPGEATVDAPEPSPAAPPAPTPSLEEPAPPGPPEEAASGEEPPPDANEPRSDFASLVRSLATTAYSALGL